jgi:hypothetical protein
MKTFKDGTYNRAVWLPPELLYDIAGREHHLTYSPHVREKLLADKMVKRVEDILVAIPNPLPVLAENIVEVTVLAGVVAKVVVRRPYNKDVDICLVFRVPTGNVATHWFNHRTDKHSTLDRSKFVQP